jgi:hypothetical protein
MRGYKVLALGLAAVVAFTFTACDDQPTEPEQQAQFKPDKLGNGYPSTQFDYKLNIIGVPQDKSADMDNNNGRRIFVMLNGGGTVTSPGGKNNQLKNSDVNKIYLCNSTNGENDYNKDGRCDAWRTDNPGEFGVIDANATNSDGALFGIPDPCSGVDSTDGCTPRYAIWARAKAGSGSATITTCAEEEYDYPVADDDDIWCGDNGVTLAKRSDRQAVDVTDALLRGLRHLPVRPVLRELLLELRQQRPEEPGTALLQRLTSNLKARSPAPASPGRGFVHPAPRVPALLRSRFDQLRIISTVQRHLIDRRAEAVPHHVVVRHVQFPPLRGPGPGPGRGVRHGAQGILEFGDGLETVVRVLLEALHHHVIQLGRNWDLADLRRARRHPERGPTPAVPYTVSGDR